MRKQKLEEKPLRFNADGELEDVLYCTYCWTLNELDAQTCVSCGEYIADQGPDLRARLSRIRRHASSVSSSTGGETEGIGSVPGSRSENERSSKRLHVSRQYGHNHEYDTRKGSDLRAQLYRISRYASNVASSTGGETEEIGSVPASPSEDKRSSKHFSVYGSFGHNRAYAPRQRSDMRAQLYRIRRRANHRQGQREKSWGVVIKILFALLVVYLLHVLWVISALVLHW